MRSTMARRLRARRRQRSPEECGGDDRLSALTDDLLLLVLRRLDTRTALGTGMLSRRFAHLLLELPALDFRVSDILPASYHRCIVRHRGVMRDLWYMNSIRKELLPAIHRHERRATRALVRSINSFVDANADDDENQSRRRRKVSSLRLEFFGTNHNGGRINRLISKAIDDWGLEELEAVWKPFFHQKLPAHEFPTRGLCCSDPRFSRLRSLTIGGCVLPPRIHKFAALTKLVLDGMADSTPYEGVITSCPQLQVLHLKSCFMKFGRLCLVVDAPMSEIKELIVDNCQMMALRMRALPKLERIASLGLTRLVFESTTSSYPCLRQCHLAYLYGHGRKLHPSFIDDLTLESFFSSSSSTPDITNLIIRFTGRERWIVPSCSPSSSSSLLPGLTRLLVADVPSFWDVSWPRILLDAAPLLRILHIHIALCVDEPDDVEIPWQPDVVLHHRLEEFAMAGFEGTERQVYFVKFVVGACTALRNVTILKDRDVQYKGFWDWEMPRLREYSWTCEEEESMEKQIRESSSASADHLKVVLA